MNYGAIGDGLQDDTPVRFYSNLYVPGPIKLTLKYLLEIWLLIMNSYWIVQIQLVTKKDIIVKHIQILNWFPQFYTISPLILI